MMNGKVKWYNAARGFGFLTADEDGKDYFVDWKALRSNRIGDLIEGQRLRFDTCSNGRGGVLVDKIILPEQPAHKPCMCGRMLKP